MSCHECGQKITPGLFVRFHDPEVVAGRAWRWLQQRVVATCGRCA